jgi:hypothetical protein
MGNTRIEILQKTKSVDYGDKDIVNFWLKINDNVNFNSENNNLMQIISVFDEIQDSIICIQTEELNHPEIIKAIYNASKKHNRIYILTNKKDKDLQQFEGVCLVRFGIKNIGSFILVNPNTNSNKGIIFTAPLIETSLANAENISLNLDNGQVKTLFRFFSDNFWNKAQFEIIEDFNTPKETSEPPLDFLPNIEDFCDVDFIKDEISKINTDAIVSVPNLKTNDLLNFENMKNSHISTSLMNNDDDLLISLASDNSIYAYPNNIIRLIISDNNDSWLIPKTNISNDDNLFALKLNSQQIKTLTKKLKDNIENAELEFHLSKTRKELENKTIRLLNNIKTEIEIKSENNIKLPNIELSELLPKEEFENQEPDFMGDNISVKINYIWEIIPFFKPNNAKKAKLYQDWEKYQNEYNTFINQIEKAINESETKNIGETLKRWFLGKKQTISKLKQELEEIKDIKLSILEIRKRNDFIKKINELAKKVSANLREIDTEIKKSEIETEIEQLKNQKEEKELQLNNFIEKQENKLNEIEKNKDEKLKLFLEKYNLKKEELPKSKSEWQRKKNKKKEKIAEDQKILDELKEIEGFDFSKKYEDDKQKFKKEIKNIETQIKSKEKELEKIGKQQQQNESSSLNSVLGKGQNNKNLTQNNELSIPDIDYLPKTGELFEVGKQKYLEIEFWEDYESGKKEAERLKAKLCAKPIKN